MKNWYEMNHQEVLETLHTRHDGLNEEEVEKIRAEKGSNKLEETKLKTPFAIFLSQFADLLVIILIIAASVSLFTGDVESTLVIVAVLILNAILGTVQSVNAQKSLAALKSLSSPHVKVIRHGQRLEIDSVDVVPGDIVMLDAGDMICADGRILESFSLQVNESSLTGESTNVEKKDEVLQGEVQKQACIQK